MACKSLTFPMLTIQGICCCFCCCCCCCVCVWGVPTVIYLFDSFSINDTCDFFCLCDLSRKQMTFNRQTMAQLACRCLKKGHISKTQKESHTSQKVTQSVVVHATKSHKMCLYTHTPTHNFQAHKYSSVSSGVCVCVCVFPLILFNLYI